MSESTETTVAEVVKVSVADRKTLASNAFVVGADPVAVAALFANVPNGREFVDVCYSANVTRETLAAVADDDAANIAERIAPYAELRESVLAAMTVAGVTTKTERVIDPVAVRAALIERAATLGAIMSHLATAGEWVSDLLGEIEIDSPSAEEETALTSGIVPEKVAALTTRLATLIEKAPKSADGSTGTRETQDHSADAAKLVIGYVLVAKGDESKTAEVIGAVNDKGRGPGAFLVNGEKVDSISTAASRLAGGERNGWTYFAL